MIELVQCVYKEEIYFSTIKPLVSEKKISELNLFKNVKYILIKEFLNGYKF